MGRKGKDWVRQGKKAKKREGMATERNVRNLKEREGKRRIRQERERQGGKVKVREGNER